MLHDTIFEKFIQRSGALSMENLVFSNFLGPLSNPERFFGQCVLYGGKILIQYSFWVNKYFFIFCLTYLNPILLIFCQKFVSNEWSTVRDTFEFSSYTGLGWVQGLEKFSYV